MSVKTSSLTDFNIALNSSSFRVLSGYLIAVFLIGALLSALPLLPGIALMALTIIGWLGLLELNTKNRGSL